MWKTCLNAVSWRPNSQLWRISWCIWQSLSTNRSKRAPIRLQLLLRHCLASRLLILFLLLPVVHNNCLHRCFWVSFNFTLMSSCRLCPRPKVIGAEVIGEMIGSLRNPSSLMISLITNLMQKSITFWTYLHCLQSVAARAIHHHGTVCTFELRGLLAAVTGLAFLNRRHIFKI
mgnify:CR=1 FL=1